MQERWRKFVVPAAAGLLLVPAAAVAGARMLTEPEEPATVEAPSALPTVAAVETTDPFATACGTEAQQLIADERDGALDAVAQAALDALRPICEQAGLPLSPAPEPDPIVVVEEVPVQAPSSPSLQAVPATAAGTPASPRVVHVTATRSDDHDDEDDDHDDEDED